MIPAFAPPRFGTGWPPDPLFDPAAYRGLVWRRMLGYLIDAVILAFLISAIHLTLGLIDLMSFGLLWPLHLLFLPMLVALAYHSLQIASPAGGTLGMRATGVRAWDLEGRVPDWPRALLHTILFYATFLILGGLLLVVALFNPKSRTLHDILAGVVMVREY